MKKGRSLLLPVLVLGLLTSSCLKNTQAGGSDERFTVSRITAAYTPTEDVNTKNEMGSVNYDVYWTAGDQIAIVNMGNGAIHRYTVNSSSVGKIKGVFDANGEYSYGDEDRLVAVYPYEAASWSGSSLFVTLNNEVEYHTTTDIPAFKNNDIQVSKVMTGAQFKSLVSSSSSLSFYRMVALVSAVCAFSNDYLRAQNASEVAICHEGVCGTAQVQFNGEGEPSVENGPGMGANSDRLTIALSPAHSMTSTNSYTVKFIPIFPVNENNGLAFVLRTEDYETGFYLKHEKIIASNRHQLFILFDKDYMQVASRSEATTDRTWWWNAIAAQNSAGSFLAPDDAKMEGNNAGSFVNAN